MFTGLPITYLNSFCRILEGKQKCFQGCLPLSVKLQAILASSVPDHRLFAGAGQLFVFAQLLAGGTCLRVFDVTCLLLSVSGQIWVVYILLLSLLLLVSGA